MESSHLMKTEVLSVWDGKRKFWKWILMTVAQYCMYMYLMLPNCTLQNGESGNFYLCTFLPQFLIAPKKVTGPLLWVPEVFLDNKLQSVKFQSNVK